MDSCRETENLSPPPVGSCCSSPGSSLEEEPLLQLNASATDITSTSLMADSSGHRNQNPGHERILYCSHNSCHPYPFSLSISLSLSLSLSHVFLPLLFCFLLLFNNPFSSTVALSRSQTHRNTMLETQRQLVSEKCKLRIVFELQKNCTNGVSELLLSIVLPLPGASSSPASSSSSSSSSSLLDSRPPFPRRPRPLRPLRRPLRRPDRKLANRQQAHRVLLSI